jgi:two-component system chemotaxis response regulator CheY
VAEQNLPQSVEPIPGPPRVLVVDDSIVVRKVLAMTVRQLPGFMDVVIDEAGNGAIALKKLAKHRYSFVLSDVRMPLVDGLELVSRIRNELEDRETPVVLISTLGTQADIDRGVAAGATAYVIKPLSPYHIRLALLEILRQAKSPA